MHWQVNRSASSSKQKSKQLWWKQQHQWLAVSPSCISRISACQFQNYWTWDQFWFVLVWLACFNYRQAFESKSMKTPSTLQACSFFSNPCLEFCFSAPSFSSVILFDIFVHFTLRDFQFMLWNPRYSQKVLCQCLLQALFSCYPNSTWFWTYKTHDLKVALLQLSELCLYKLPCKSSGGRKKKKPFELSFCGYFKFIWWIVQIRYFAQIFSLSIVVTVTQFPVFELVGSEAFWQRFLALIMTWWLMLHFHQII